MARLRLLPWWWIVPAAIFGLHAAVFGGWLIDDAGITLAYARNVALGHGIVAQPGLTPVEGYSNPLWMALFVPLLLAGRGRPAVDSQVAGGRVRPGGLWRDGEPCCAGSARAGAGWPGSPAPCWPSIRPS